jgi:asparagine synthetase B (glutamine-hydrolysing)
MCGITGIIHLNGEPVSPTLLQQMTDAIAHRGRTPRASGSRAMWAWAIIPEIFQYLKRWLPSV